MANNYTPDSNTMSEEQYYWFNKGRGVPNKSGGSVNMSALLSNMRPPLVSPNTSSGGMASGSESPVFAQQTQRTYNPSPQSPGGSMTGGSEGGAGGFLGAARERAMRDFMGEGGLGSLNRRLPGVRF